MVDATKDMNVGTVKHDMVCWTRCLYKLAGEPSAPLKRNHRDTMCTEYSTAKPIDKTNDMLAKSVKFTSARILPPTTGTKVKIIVIAMSKAPSKLRWKTTSRVLGAGEAIGVALPVLSVGWINVDSLWSCKSVPKRKISAIAKPVRIAYVESSTRTSQVVSY